MIHINNTYELTIPVKENQIKTIVKSIFSDYQILLNELGVTFLTDDALLEINQQFLKHDYYTDIITFYYSEENEPLEAELFISLDRVKENAATLKQSFDNEIMRVIIHGCLHLCGFSDETDIQKQKMREEENKFLEKVFHVKQKQK